MNISYFNNVNTIEELKKEYRKLILKNHPDVGGSHETMKNINTEYDYLLNNFDKIASQKAKENNEKYYSKIDDGFKEVLSKIINLNIEIEIVGGWIWASGENTKEHKELLKELNFFWSSKHKVWMFVSNNFKKTKYRTKNTKQDIVNKYGSTKVINDIKLIA